MAPAPTDSASAPPPSSGKTLAFFGALILSIAGIAVVVFAVLMPVGLRGIDPAVLAAAGNGTESLDQAEALWVEAGKPGVAILFAEAHEQIESDEPRLQIFPDAAAGADRFLELWGGSDPFLEQIFADFQPETEQAHPPVLPLFISRNARRALGEFLEGARHPGVQAVLGNREVEFAQDLMPARSSSGQPLEATIYLTALLLQGNHLPQKLSGDIRRLAEEANTENDLGEIEPVYLDLVALGSRVQWQPLAELTALFKNRDILRRTAHLSQVLEEDWPVFAATALWVGDADQTSAFLVENGRDGLDDLKQAMGHGKGAVELLLDRQEPVAAISWRERIPETPVFLADLNATSPVTGVILKLGLLLLGLWILVLAINLFPRIAARGKAGSGRPFSISFFQSLLLATAAALVLLFFVEPLLLESGRTSEFRLRFPISVASAEAESSTDQGIPMQIDQVTTLSVLVFFAIQMILYFICWIKMLEIRRQPIGSHLKLQLLENEDHLFDAGLYVGLAGTVGALIFLAFGVVDLGLMSAYASTLFGIVFVAAFKIFHLRPYRRHLIIDSQVAG